MTYPSDKEGWANCLSQVKRLALKYGRLLQKPVKAMKSLRGVEEDFTGDLAFDAGAQSELKLTIKQGQKGRASCFWWQTVKVRTASSSASRPASTPA